MRTNVVEREKGLPRKRGKKIAVISLAVILTLLLIVIIAAYVFVRRSLPVTEGEVTVRSLQQKAAVYRDNHGVPHIEAKTLHDLYVAQGYVTAQDRMFQMDLSRRQASGELSEVIGKATVDQDKFFRTLGLRRAAEVSYNAYSDEAKQVLQWYADGVNAYIKEAKANGTLPVEFTLAGYKPKEWTPIDSLTIGKYMAFDLGGHWEGQAFRYYLAQNFSEEKALDLFPSYPEDGPTVIQALKEQKLDIPKSFATAVVPNEWNGSNNWVVSGDKTKSGYPYLADDPHLGLATPAIWYETHLKGPKLNVSGVIFAGVPGIILGRNDHIAWGVTNVGPDVQDLYIEKRNPDNPAEFEYNGKWEQAKVVSEPIKVKGQKTIPYDVVVTRHGPIISEFAHDDQPNTALAMRWTALEPSTELEAVMKFNAAKNWEEFKQALTFFHTPAQNFVFAAKDGTIAYRANGLIPIRKKGDSSVPVPGWTDEYEWKGYIPWEELPTVVNPKEGFISTANNKVVGDDYPYHITNTWAQPYRQERIREVLGSKEQFTVEDMLALQFDQHNLQAKEFMPLFLKKLLAQKDKWRKIDSKVYKELVDWKYVDSKDEAAPLVFHLWMQEIADVLFEKEITKEMDELFEGKAQIVDQLIRRAAEGEPGPWMEDAGGLETVVWTAYKRAVDRSSELQGENPGDWNWGEFHAVPFKHPLSAIKPLNYLFNYKDPIPMGGSRVTVGAAGWKADTGEVNHGASWRSVVDLQDLSRSYNVVGPGQSGHVLSEWYYDQAEDWTTGKYHITYTDSEKYKRGSDRLILQPGQ
ncbi:penicillin acylase family protein [Bacillus rubiinfantis]|uniref:penicillin acylase family protein n=1 Tax=Bacillus rubiinfantis TaxID=1499680 RepID=UPI0005AAD6A0|nr:penicillin acylase family protein [Bacillus rubiinfantis]